MISASESTRSGSETGEWDRLSTWRWSFIVTHLALLGFVMFDGVSSVRLGVAVALIIAALVNRVLWGERLIQSDFEGPVIGFLAVSFAIAAGLFAVHPIFLFSLFAYFPMCFMVGQTAPTERYSTAILSIIAMVGIAGWDGWTVRAWALAVAQGAVMIVFAFGTGRWIMRIIHESRQRQRLLDELAAARNELAEAHRQAGIRSERERLAGEIHDTLAQGFASLLLLTRAIRPLVRTSPEKVDALLDTAEKTAQENLDEARALVGALQPAALEGRSISGALFDLAARFREESHIECVVTIDGELDRCDIATQAALLRASQEGLANIRRHAEARAAALAVQVSDDDGTVVLEVHDDGRGGAEEAHGRFGLSGLRSRAAPTGRHPACFFPTRPRHPSPAHPSDPIVRTHMTPTTTPSATTLRGHLRTRQLRPPPWHRHLRQHRFRADCGLFSSMITPLSGLALRTVIETESDITVVGEATDGPAGVRLVARTSTGCRAHGSSDAWGAMGPTRRPASCRTSPP